MRQHGRRIPATVFEGGSRLPDPEESKGRARVVELPAAERPGRDREAWIPCEDQPAAAVVVATDGVVVRAADHDQITERRPRVRRTEEVLRADKRSDRQDEVAVPDAVERHVRRVEIA